MSCVENITGIAQANTKLITASTLADQFANGGVNDTVTNATGTHPSFAKAVNDLQSSNNTEIANIVAGFDATQNVNQWAGAQTAWGRPINIEDEPSFIAGANYATDKTDFTFNAYDATKQHPYAWYEIQFIGAADTVVHNVKLHVGHREGVVGFVDLNHYISINSYIPGADDIDNMTHEYVINNSTLEVADSFNYNSTSELFSVVVREIDKFSSIFRVEFHVKQDYYLNTGTYPIGFEDYSFECYQLYNKSAGSSSPFNITYGISQETRPANGSFNGTRIINGSIVFTESEVPCLNFVNPVYYNGAGDRGFINNYQAGYIKDLNGVDYINEADYENDIKYVETFKDRVLSVTPPNYLNYSNIAQLSIAYPASGLANGTKGYTISEGEVIVENGAWVANNPAYQTIEDIASQCTLSGGITSIDSIIKITTGKKVDIYLSKVNFGSTATQTVTFPVGVFDNALTVTHANVTGRINNDSGASITSNILTIVATINTINSDFVVTGYNN